MEISAALWASWLGKDFTFFYSLMSSDKTSGIGLEMVLESP